MSIMSNLKDTIIKTQTSIETCPYKTGFKQINVGAFMGDQGLIGRPLAMRCMIAAWASMMNLSRKGDAKKLREMGQKAFGEEEFESAIDECLKQASRSDDCQK